jgi:hypothetical protein
MQTKRASKFQLTAEKLVKMAGAVPEAHHRQYTVVAAERALSLRAARANWLKAPTKATMRAMESAALELGRACFPYFEAIGQSSDPKACQRVLSAAWTTFCMDGEELHYFQRATARPWRTMLELSETAHRVDVDKLVLGRGDRA